MKIGDEVYVHGSIDEIRKNTVIISNDGGYFGTVSSEIIEAIPRAVIDNVIKEIEEEYIKIDYDTNYKLGSSYGLRKALNILKKHIKDF